LSEPRLARGRTAFLDRDGTINESPAEGEYLDSPADVRLIEGVVEAIKALNDHGARVVVVTNQRGIALGKMSEADLRAVNGRIEAELARAGARLDAILYCPHHEGACDCRKPGTGMFERAAHEIDGVEIAGGAMVGDSSIDVEAGRRLELTTVRIGAPAPGDPEADHAAESLLDAVEWLIGAG
jgi:D-glycero-D-manno-heptose 1,7-bisphosphate phosphatase